MQKRSNMKEEEIQFAEQIIKDSSLYREFEVGLEQPWGRFFANKVHDFLDELRLQFPYADTYSRERLEWELHPENLYPGLARKFDKMDQAPGFNSISINQREVEALGNLILMDVMFEERSSSHQQLETRLDLIREMAGFVDFAENFSQASGKPAVDQSVFADKIQQLIYFTDQREN